MKKLLFAIPFLALLTGSSCKKVDELTEFDINYSTTQSVPGASLSVNGPVDFTTPDVETKSSEKFAAQGTAKDLIDEIKVTKFEITNETGNFNFLKSVAVFIKADGLDEVRIATKTEIPALVKTISLDVSNANIKEYIFKEKIRFRLNVEVKTLPSTDQQLKLDQTLHVKGKKLSK